MLENVMPETTRTSRCSAHRGRGEELRTRLLRQVEHFRKHARDSIAKYMEEREDDFLPFLTFGEGDEEDDEDEEILTTGAGSTQTNMCFMTRAKRHVMCNGLTSPRQMVARCGLLSGS